ncbi:QRFP-like peptide receptor [Ptychodera flava]|uniref:QRFP-like peptide receptor n=1 Tax=Ptychodera flava TaxID=63121 RepID=UPI003969FDAF
MEEFVKSLNLSDAQVTYLRANCSAVYGPVLCVQIQRILELLYGPCRYVPKGYFPVFGTDFVVTIVISYVLVFVLTMFGNIVVVIVMLKFRRMRTVTNIYLVSLAFSDLMIALFCMPFDTLYSVTTNWPFGEAMCKISRFVQTFSVSTSVLTLTAIAADRYIAILYPLKARLIHTNQRAIIILLIIWVLSAAMMTPQLFVLTTRDICDPDSLKIYTTCVEIWGDDAIIPGTNTSTSITSSTHAYSLYLLFALWIVPLSVMAFAYIRIGHRLWTQKPIGDGLGTNNTVMKHEQSLKQKKKLIKMLMVILVLFAVCWGPMFLWNVVRDFTYNFYHLASKHADWTYKVFAAIRLIAYSNSCFNPIIYHKMSENFKNHFRATLGCACCKTNKVGDATATLTQHNNTLQSVAAEAVQ